MSMSTKRAVKRTSTRNQNGTRTNTVHDAYHDLREMIIRGVLAPGAPLIERRLAERLEVSRGSLRSALQRLEHEGFIQPARAGLYTRAVVTPLTVADMDDIYTLTAALNGAAAEQASRLPAVERLRVADNMQRLNDQFHRVVHSGPGEANGTLTWTVPDQACAHPSGAEAAAALYEIDQQLHRCYIDVAGGPRLRSLCAAVGSQHERYGRAYASAMGAATLSGPATSSITEHQVIIDAIRAGDPEAAERAAVRNWRQAADRFRRVIATAGERGSF